jgi:hypothetical protein
MKKQAVAVCVALGASSFLGLSPARAYNPTNCMPVQSSSRGDSGYSETYGAGVGSCQARVVIRCSTQKGMGNVSGQFYGNRVLPGGSSAANCTDGNFPWRWSQGRQMGTNW